MGGLGGRWIGPARRRGARPASAVAAIARLGQQVGTEASSRLGLHELVDLALWAGCIQVVDHLGSLVAEPAVLLEALGTGHG